MTEKTMKKPLAIAAGAALAVGLSGVSIADAEASPFAMTALTSGYMAGAHTMGEGKCGEGKCGGGKGEEGACGGDKGGEGSCGGEKGDEGKCGEGKCGGSV